MSSVGLRLAIIISSVLFILVVITGVLLDRHVSKSIVEEESRQAAAHARTMLSSLNTLMLSGKGTLAQGWLAGMREQEGIVGIDVIRKDGSEAFTDTNTINDVNSHLNELRFSREATNQRIGNHSTPEFNKAVTGEVVFDKTVVGVITVYQPINASNECLICHGYDMNPVRGVLRLSLSTEAAEQRLESMRRSLWGVGIVLVAILGITLWGTVNFIVLRPLAELRHAFVRVGRGDRTLKLPEQRNDELGKSVAVFNRMQDQLQETEQRISAVVDNVVDSIITSNHAGMIEAVNPAVTKMFAYDEQELLGQSIKVLILAPDDESADAEGSVVYGHANLLGKNRKLTGVRKDGEHFPVDVTVTEMVVGETRYLLTIIRDFTEQHMQMDALEHQALHDALTDLPNRILLGDRLEQGIQSAQRQSKPLSLLLIDLDHFKDVNDTLGHHFGDMVLKQVALYFRDVVRSSDTVARLGGDEFAILLPTADLDHALKIARKLINKLDEPFVIEEHTFVMNASIGIATYPEHGLDGVTLMKRADVAMYAAKQRRSGFSIYDSSHDPHSLQALSLMNDLRQAVANDELVLCYQPVIDLSNGHINGVEALARWQHPKYGMLYPDDFIPMAEQTGLIRPLTMWVLENAARQSQQWQGQGLELRIAVNLSAHNLHDTNFPEKFLEVLEKEELGLPSLRLEITETAIMSGSAQAQEVLNKLSARGVRISIDDFGTGYSSLTYLKQLPVDEIKIDKSFVTHMAVDENDIVIVRSTIDLAHNMGMKVVAEGVEDEATYDLLTRLHCDAIQGYYVTEPLIADELVAWMAESRWGVKE